jgi:hypothetical protein
MEDHHININKLREINQVHLETFSFVNNQNWFENSMNSAIDRLLIEKSKTEKEKEKFIASKNYYPKKVEGFKNPFEAEGFDINIESQISEYNIKNHDRDEELFALAEMKIIYLFKIFEINLKKLVTQSFENNSTKNFYKWESITAFLKSKNINIKQVDKYNEIFQLKELNNSLKHNDSPEKKLIHLIPELSHTKNVIWIDKDLSITKINFEELDLFYNRIRELPNIFLNNLASKIFKELYEFDNEKLEKITNEICQKMDKKSAMKLISKIKRAYNIK